MWVELQQACAFGCGRILVCGLSYVTACTWIWVWEDPRLWPELKQVRGFRCQFVYPELLISIESVIKQHEFHDTRPVN